MTTHISRWPNLPVAVSLLLFSGLVHAQNAPAAKSAAQNATADNDAEDEGPVRVRVKGIFDHRFILYTNQINWTPSNKARTFPFTTDSGTRADVWTYEGPPPGSPAGTPYELQQGAFLDAIPPNLPRFDDVSDTMGEIRYRPRVELSTLDGVATGIIELEFGGIRFGAPGTGRGEGGSFSTDGANIETRLAYADFAIAQQHHLALGLIPFDAHEYLWKEAAAGIRATGPLSDMLSYKLAWVRGLEDRRSPVNPHLDPIGPLPKGLSDMDALFARIGASFGDHSAGLLALYQWGGVDSEEQYYNGTDVYAEGYSLFQFPSVDFRLISAGVDGHFVLGDAWVDLDAILQFGTFRNVNFFAADSYAFDPMTGAAIVDAISRDGCGGGTAAGALPATVQDRLSRYAQRSLVGGGVCADEFKQSGLALRLEAGMAFGATSVSGVVSYVSGDDNPRDADWKGFLSTDVDVFDSAIFQEGVLVNDTVQDQDPYLFDKGFVLGKVQVAQRIGEKLTLAAAGVFNQLAQPVSWSGLVNPDSPGTNPPDPADPMATRTIANWKSKDLGIEGQLRAKYEFTEHVSSNLLAATLLTRGAALDFFEVGLDRNGVSDKSYVTVQANVQYVF